MRHLWPLGHKVNKLCPFVCGRHVARFAIVRCVGGEKWLNCQDFEWLGD